MIINCIDRCYVLSKGAFYTAIRKLLGFSKLPPPPVITRRTDPLMLYIVGKRSERPHGKMYPSCLLAINSLRPATRAQDRSHRK